MKPCLVRKRRQDELAWVVWLLYPQSLPVWPCPPTFLCGGKTLKLNASCYRKDSSLSLRGWSPGFVITEMKPYMRRTRKKQSFLCSLSNPKGLLSILAPEPACQSNHHFLSKMFGNSEKKKKHKYRQHFLESHILITWTLQCAARSPGLVLLKNLPSHTTLAGRGIWVTIYSRTPSGRFVVSVSKTQLKRFKTF